MSRPLLLLLIVVLLVAGGAYALSSSVDEVPTATVEVPVAS